MSSGVAAAWRVYVHLSNTDAHRNTDSYADTAIGWGSFSEFNFFVFSLPSFEEGSAARTPPPSFASLRMKEGAPFSQKRALLALLPLIVLGVLLPADYAVCPTALCLCFSSPLLWLPHGSLCQSARAVTSSFVILQYHEGAPSPPSRAC